MLNWQDCVVFHGHACPGLAIGYRVVEWVRDCKEWAFNDALDEEVVCVSENDSCAVDAIQVLSHLTIGKGALRIDMQGKMAFTFYFRAQKKAYRIRLKPNVLKGDKQAKMYQVLSKPFNKLFQVEAVHTPPPHYARMYETLVCTACEEGVAEGYTTLYKGKTLCLSCFQQRHG